MTFCFGALVASVDNGTGQTKAQGPLLHSGPRGHASLHSESSLQVNHRGEWGHMAWSVSGLGIMRGHGPATSCRAQGMGKEDTVTRPLPNHTCKGHLYNCGLQTRRLWVGGASRSDTSQPLHYATPCFFLIASKYSDSCTRWAFTGPRNTAYSGSTSHGAMGMGLES